MINLLRIWSKRILPHIPFVGPWFKKGFRKREADFERRQRIAELQSQRATARLWRQRIVDALACPDNSVIPRCAGAGSRDGGDIIMHNGLRVAYGTYGTYDANHTMRLLEENGGVHEPQEEIIFQQVLPLLPLGAVMLELGAFWGFYSMWFAQQVPQGCCFLVEPVWANLNAGRLNFSINRLNGTFINGFVGAKYRKQPFQAPVLSVDWIMEEHGLERIHLLHSDIQGFERQMLDGAANAITQGKVDWIFISTHSNDLHRECRDWLKERQWTIVADANLDDSYSVDGLIAAHRPGLTPPTLHKISLKRQTPR